MSAGDCVELTPSEEGFTVRKALTHRHRTLKERLEEFYRTPISEVPRSVSAPEINWGEPTGHEIW